MLSHVGVQAAHIPPQERPSAKQNHRHILAFDTPCKDIGQSDCIWYWNVARPTPGSILLKHIGSNALQQDAMSIMLAAQRRPTKTG